MKEIDEFKKRNGGTVDYSVKELIGGIHVKLDKIGERLEISTAKIDKNKVGISRNWSLIKILVTAIVMNTFGLVVMLIMR